MAPIRALLMQENEFCWREEIHGVAFDRPNLKALLTNAPVLAFFDSSKPIVVQCDASQGGMAAVLLQNGQPVEYASRAMTRIEKDSCSDLCSDRKRTFKCRTWNGKVSRPSSHCADGPQTVDCNHQESTIVGTQAIAADAIKAAALHIWRPTMKYISPLI